MGNKNDSMKQPQVPSHELSKVLYLDPDLLRPLIRPQDADPDFLLRLLECPVCAGVMRAPIFQCIYGHSVCGPCRTKVATCPTCRARFRGTRNLLAEGLAERVLLSPCRFADAGCKDLLNYADMESHLRVCPYRPYTCKICQEKVPLDDIKAHCLRQHPDYALSRKSRSAMGSSCKTDMYICELVASTGELFWFWRRYTASQVFMGVQMCGKENTQGFRYHLSLSDRSKRREILFTGPAHADGEPQEEIEARGVCFCVTRTFINSILETGVIQLRVTPGE